MYKSLFEWIRATQPEIKTVWGGVEKDFAHSNATYNVMKANAEKAGFEVKGTSEWLLADTSFSTQVREMRRGEADLVMISAGFDAHRRDPIGGAGQSLEEADFAWATSAILDVAARARAAAPTSPPSTSTRSP